MAVSLESIQNFFSDSKQNTQASEEQTYMTEVYVASSGKTHVMDNVRYREAASRMERIIRATNAKREREANPVLATPLEKPHRNRLMTAAVTLFTAIK